ncbi:ABC transporter permease [Patiriisocius marinus]|uniref:ABC transporter permease n=1 Tax=Patiriisocius marinus TaxID=1397112 RepID=A0A5J4IU38_9FLAO|nr:ABC transporter permease [Patiriisocius marinus]GER58174.1 ABC transporter permease [Patiriisocius marinus]
MLIYFRVLKESFNFAINALTNNKLRTFLSLLGVTIGIFSIIAVLAAVDSLKKEIEGSLSGIDNSTIIVMRFPFTSTDIPQWKWRQFPDVTYEEYEYLKRSLPDAKAVCYVLNVPSETLKYEDRTVSNVDIAAVTYEYPEIETLELSGGRFFTESESGGGAPVLIIGDEIANSLFGSPDEALGKKIRLYGRKFTVIGVLKKEGNALGGGSKDTAALVSVNVARRIYGDNSKSVFPQITIKPEKNIDQDGFMATISLRLRTIRGIRAEEGDTFFVNQFQGIADIIDNITGQMNVIGLVISLFSLLVGGFGIANIMFVSVKERTNLIGIQKSLGAKNKFILFQFLFEAVILAIIGGLIGLVLVYLVSLLASSMTGEFNFVLSIGNMVIGTVISAAIGLISGILPAISASRLDPVEAIRTGM